MFKGREGGISHRIVHLWLVIIIVIFSGTVVYSTFRMTNTFLRIIAASKQNSELQKAAHDLMNASDYLTEQVQRFTINGDIRFLDRYFTEAFESKRREEAISKMDVDDRTDGAVRQLKNAMDNSIKLMDQEYYAMRLVIEAKGYADYPELLDDVELDDEDIVDAEAKEYLDKINKFEDPYAATIGEYTAAGKTSAWHWQGWKAGLAQNVTSVVFQDFAKGSIKDTDQFLDTLQKAIEAYYAQQ